MAGAHELVAQQAQRTPDAVAVVFGDLRLSYRELETAAQRVAHQLEALRPASPVGSGRAFARHAGRPARYSRRALIAADPAYPTERLWFSAAGRRPPSPRHRAIADGLPPHDARVVVPDAEPIGERQGITLTRRFRRRLTIGGMSSAPPAPRPPEREARSPPRSRQPAHPMSWPRSDRARCVAGGDHAVLRHRRPEPSALDRGTRRRRAAKRYGFTRGSASC